MNWYVIAIGLFLASFLYSLGAWAAVRLFNRLDPSSNYDGTERCGRTEPFTSREWHQLYVFLCSILWPISSLICLLTYVPYRIILRIENHLDRPKDPFSDKNERPYR